MTAAQARRSTASAKIASPAATEVIGMFAKRNPTSSKSQLEEVGKLVADFGAAAVKLSPAGRKRLIARRAQLRQLIAEIAEPELDGVEPLALQARAPAETSQGDGLGEVISAEAAAQRLQAYATPQKIEDWAGPVAGATELERDYGVARSTLHTWQKQGAVVGLLVGVRKHAFPTDQFVDGRPVAGLAAIVEVIGDLRTAWAWLRQPNPTLAGAAPLARLKAGLPEPVLEAARSAFGQA